MNWVFTKPSTVRPRFFPYHVYPAWCSIVLYLAKQHYLRNRSKSVIITELQQNLQKQINISCSFNQVLIKRKKLCCKKSFDPAIHFDLMINFDFFWPNNLGFPRGVSVEFVLWTFPKLCKRQKNLTLLTFDCPNYKKILLNKMVLHQKSICWLVCEHC